MDQAGQPTTPIMQGIIDWFTYNRGKVVYDKNAPVY